MPSGDFGYNVYLAACPTRQVLDRILATKPTSVEYSLTALGQTLTGPLAAIRLWAEQHIEELLAARSAGS